MEYTMMTPWPSEKGQLTITEYTVVEQFFKMGLKSYGYDGNDGFFRVASACNFIKSNNPPWAIFTFFKLCKWYQIAQSVSSNNT